MTGWRLGFAVGNADVLEALATVKDNVDSCVFTAIQRAGEAALALPESRLAEQLEVYRRRRDVLVDGLHKVGLERPEADGHVLRLGARADGRALAGVLAGACWSGATW